MVVVGQAVRDLLLADGVTLAVRDRGHFSFSYAAEDAVSPLWKDRPLPMNGCIAGWCMTHGEAVGIADIYQDARMRTEIYRPDFVRSLAMAPVGLDEPIAALGAYWTEAHPPQPEELERLQAIADGAALAMVSLRQSQQDPPRSKASEPNLTAAPGFGEPTHTAADSRASVRTNVERFLHQGLPANSPQAYAFAAACVLVATLLRMSVGISGGQSLTAYSFYYPATLIALLVGGRRAGVLAAVLGGFATYYFFTPPLFRLAPLTSHDLLNLSLYAISCALIVLVIDGYQRAVRRLKSSDALHLTLALEQQHRTRNALNIVEIIVRESLRDDPLRAGSINQRVRAGFTDVQVHLRNRPIGMLKLLSQELEPFDLKRFTLASDGETLLAPEVSSILTLAAHELATNALKYGALSSPEGRVTVQCSAADGRATILWRESGGPPVGQPKKRGFGSVMLHRVIESAGGTVGIEYLLSGVTAAISLPLVVARRS